MAICTCVCEGKVCSSEWKVLRVRLSSSRPWQKNFLSAIPPYTPPALHSPLASHFFLLPPPLFCVLPLPFSTSTGLSKWSQRNALWSNNPGGWHRRDEREKGGERTRRLGEWRNWEMETVARRGEETGWKLRCMKIRWKSSKLNMRTHLEIDGCPAS